MKTISFEEAWALLGKGETLLRQFPGDEAWREVRINPERSRVEVKRGDRWDDEYPMETIRSYKWAIHEDPPKPKVVRVECEWRMKGGIFAKKGAGTHVPIDYELKKQGLADRTPLTALIFPADLLEELDEAAREWFAADPYPAPGRTSSALEKALEACGIGTARAEGEPRP